jgi:probable HAF family extracellular repeat protein
MSSLGKLFSKALIICSIFSMSPGLFAQAQCGTQILTIPSPAGTFTQVTDLDDKGDILGKLVTNSGTSITGFLFSQGVFTHFRFPGSVETIPLDINRNSVIVGSFDLPATGAQEHAFMAHSGTFSEIKLPGFPDASVVAFGINDQGDIVGVFTSNSVSHGFLLHQGELTIISFPGAQGGTAPASINNAGVIVGTFEIGTGPPEGTPINDTQGFMWKDGNFTTIDVPGAQDTLPAKINDNGAIVGTYLDSTDGAHGFAFSNGQFFDIELKGPNTQIFALNNFSNVLGVSDAGTFKGFCSAVF